jgi:hypothetical protein
MVFLPFYLPTSSLLRQRKLGFSALTLWVIGQVRIMPLSPLRTPLLTISVGSMATTRILARVPRSIDFCAGALGSQCPFLRHKLLDPRDCGIRYCPTTLQPVHQAVVMRRVRLLYIASFSFFHKSNGFFHPSSASSSALSLSACVETQFSNICVPDVLPPADFLTPLRLTIKHKIRP